MSKLAAIIGRLLIALIFIFSGIGKLMDIEATRTLLASASLPASFAVPVGLFELVAGLCLAVGFMVRLVALLLALFSAGAILFFHHRFADPAEATQALKDLAIIGGLALAFAHSQMWSHYYAISREREGELIARRADDRAHAAELRAARAEAEAKAIGKVAPVAPAPASVARPAWYRRPVPVDEYGDSLERRRRWFDW